jgi:hypothetical protein
METVRTEFFDEIRIQHNMLPAEAYLYFAHVLLHVFSSLLTI